MDARWPRTTTALRPRVRGAWLLAGACLGGVVLVLVPLPAEVRALVVLPLTLLVPGLCLTRRLGLREPIVEAALAFPVSAALWVAVAQAALYLHAWSPKVGVVALLLASAASLRRELGRRAHADGVVHGAAPPQRRPGA